MSSTTDVATIAVAVAALGLSSFGLIDQRRRERRHWQQQVTLDQTSRIYTAAADLMRASATFVRLASERVQARGTLMGYGMPYDSDENDPQYAEQLREVGAPTLPMVLSAHDDVSAAFWRLWLFLPSSEERDQYLLGVLTLINDVLVAARPSLNHEAGTGSLKPLVRSYGLLDAVEITVEVPTDSAGDMERLQFVLKLTTEFLRFQVSRRYNTPLDGLVQ